MSPQRYLTGQNNVRARLLRLVLLVLVPGILMAATVTWRSLQADRAAAAARLHDNLFALGLLADGLAGQAASGLQALARSEAALRGDVAGLTDLALQVAPVAGRIVISDAAGHWLTDTGGDLPRGAPIPPRAGANGAASASWGHDAQERPVLLLTVPAGPRGPAAPGRPAALNLSLMLPQSALQAAIDGVALPQGWVGALYDSSQRVVAQSAGSVRDVSRPAGPEIAAALRTGQMVDGAGTTPSGTPMRFAAGLSPRFGVALAVMAPRAFIAEPSRVSLFLLATEGSLLVLLGLAGAGRVAASISGPIEALAVATRQLGEAGDLPPVPSGVAEANQVAEAMRTAHETLRERRAALFELNASLAKRVAARTAELAAANAALEEQRAQLGLILDHMPIGVLVLDQAGIVRFANPEVRRLLGLGAGEFDVLALPTLMRNGVAVPLGEGPPARARRGFVTERELLTLQRADGGRQEVEISAGPVFDSAGRVALSVTTMQDVAARLEAEEARRRSQRLEAVGQLTGGVAHEFNNLLMAIGGCIDLLRPIVRGERAHTLLDNAGRAADHGARLTQQLLAFARRQNLQPEPMDLNMLVSGMQDLLSSTLGRGIAVSVELEAHAWPALADTTQLELVLLNLSINARDAMPAGGRLIMSTGNASLGPPRRAEEPPAGDYAMLRVTDTGTGMTPDVLARIFEPFFTTKEVGRGTGLGLPQALGVAQQLGGGIAVDSVPNEGTTVSVYLPRANLPVDSDAARGSFLARPPPTAPAPLQGLRLLLVDDDAEVREVARSMLEDMGGLVTEASSGADALLRLRTDPDIDLVLADYTMPGMTGLELAAQVAASLPHLPTVLMTGYSAASLGASAPHVQAVLQKPFRVDALAEALEKALGAKLAVQTIRQVAAAGPV